MIPTNEILKLASDADFTIKMYANGKIGILDANDNDITEQMQKFFHLAAQATAEDCARVCDDEAEKYRKEVEAEICIDCGIAILTKYQQSRP